jgi:hypothetical protein
VHKTHSGTMTLYLKHGGGTLKFKIYAFCLQSIYECSAILRMNNDHLPKHHYGLVCVICGVLRLFLEPGTSHYNGRPLTEIINLINHHRLLTFL